MRTWLGSITCLRKPAKLPGAGAAGLDRGGEAAAAAKFFGVDAERGAAPIDTGVQIDQARGDDVARHVPHVGSGIGLELAPDHDHLAAGKADIAMASSFWDGSITRPPRHTRSNGGLPEENITLRSQRALSRYAARLLPVRACRRFADCRTSPDSRPAQRYGHSAARWSDRTSCGQR
jgi:hypothetical protein